MKKVTQNNIIVAALIIIPSLLIAIVNLQTYSFPVIAGRFLGRTACIFIIYFLTKALFSFIAKKRSAKRETPVIISAIIASVIYYGLMLIGVS